MQLRGWLALSALALAIALTGCSRADPSIIASAPEAAATGEAGGATLDVAADPAALAFQQTTLQAPAGQPITVNFNNPAALQHNWVLVEPGQEQAVADATTPTNGDPTGVAGVIAGFPPIGTASQSTTVNPLEAGDYPYICTVPGHYAGGMVGTLTVQ